MIVWVVALRPEADPLIAARSLRAVGEPTAWPLFVRGDEEALVVTGVGRNACAAGCGWLQGYLRPAAHAAWLNVGIAGHSSGPSGRAVLAHKVVEQATGRAWYPPIPHGHSLTGDTLFTVDRPETDFAQPGAYDMEASGFLAATARWATTEMVQVVKVVSDTPTEPASQLDRGGVRSLIEARIDDLEVVAGALARCGEVLALRAADPPGYESLSTRWHFTVTQQRQLRRLLERHAALEGDPAVLESVTAVDGRGALGLVADRVERLSMES